MCISIIVSHGKAIIPLIVGQTLTVLTVHASSNRFDWNNMAHTDLDNFKNVLYWWGHKTQWRFIFIHNVRKTIERKKVFEQNLYNCSALIWSASNNQNEKKASFFCRRYWHFYFSNRFENFKSAFFKQKLLSKDWCDISITSDSARAESVQKFSIFVTSAIEF